MSEATQRTSIRKKIIHLDVAIIGAGPAGLAAGMRARQLGFKDVVIFDRDERPGGILPQCIHPGFGLGRYKEELTGPEYAFRAIREAEIEKVAIELGAMVIAADGDKNITVVSAEQGIRHYSCDFLIFAMGCRERTRCAVRIPGTRPAGIFTAGKAQRLLNIEGHLPGRQVVIIGSGDIGMIMARRLTLEGCTIKSVVEINPYTSGLIRNEVQCLNDFGIPLLLSHEVSEIHGSLRVEGVTLCTRDAKGSQVPGSERFVACDTILLSVGLIPENELTLQTGVSLDPTTGGPIVNDFLETEKRGIFSCGNVLHVNDLVDEVSREGEVAAQGAAAVKASRSMSLGKGITLPEMRDCCKIKLAKGSNIAQVVPQVLHNLRDTRVAIRVKSPTGQAILSIGSPGEPVVKKKLPLTRPGEMILIDIPKGRIETMFKSQEDQEVRIDCL
jgi:thioredoxin reductase